MPTLQFKRKKYILESFSEARRYICFMKKIFSLKKIFALTLELAEKFKNKNKKKRLIVYAPACFLDEEYLTENQISFVGIPYNLFEKV